MILDQLLRTPQPERDAAYDNTAAVQNAAQQLADFEARGAVLLTRVDARLDIRYGPAERQTFDYFCGQEGLPTLLFVPGDDRVYHGVAVPNDLSFVGMTLHMQALVMNPVTGLMAATNASKHVLRG